MRSALIAAICHARVVIGSAGRLHGLPRLHADDRQRPRTKWVRAPFPRERGLFGVALLGIFLTGSLPKKTFGDCIDYGTFIHQVGSASGQTGYTSVDVALYGNYAYVTGTNSLSSVGSVFVFDISNPTSPSLVNTVDLSRRAFGLAVSGSYLYVANDYDGLKIYSLSTPTSPILVGSMDTPNEALDVVISWSPRLRGGLGERASGD